jgi:UDP-glucose:(heptosyl)LPS alpha-1,3-glucosyltransferase
LSHNAYVKQVRQAPRIALIRARYNPYGGAERFVANALNALQAQGVRLTIVTRRWQEQAGVDPLIVNPFYLGNIWRDWGFAREVCRSLKQQSFDLVQSHERLSCCDVYRAGDGVHREWLKQRRRAAGRWQRLNIAANPYHRYMLNAERRVFASPQLKAVICNSRMVKEEIQQYFQVPDAKLHVIYSGVDGERFSPSLRAAERAAFRAQHAIAPDALVYLLVGSGFERKGLGFFLHALARLPPRCVGLVVGKDKHQARFERLAARLGIEQRLRFTGGVEDTRPAYGAADVFVLPTLYDPFPNAALEAMACGLPLITSLKSGAAELIEDGVNGWCCDAQNVAQLAQHMAALQDDARRLAIGKAARETVLPLTLAAMSGQLIALYRRLLFLA